MGSTWWQTSKNFEYSEANLAFSCFSFLRQGLKYPRLTSNLLGSWPLSLNSRSSSCLLLLSAGMIGAHHYGTRAELGLKLRTLCMPGTYSASWATWPALVLISGHNGRGVNRGRRTETFCCYFTFHGVAIAGCRKGGGGRIGVDFSKTLRTWKEIRKLIWTLQCVTLSFLVTVFRRFPGGVHYKSNL